MNGLEKLFEFCIKHNIDIRIMSGLPIEHRPIVLRFEDHRRNLMFSQELNIDAMNALVYVPEGIEILLKEVEFRMGLTDKEDAINGEKA